MSPGRILIVEDDYIVALDLEHHLLEMGYVVAGRAGDGPTAIQLAVEGRPDLVLMDIHLAGPLDGIQAALEIHKQCDVPIVFLTAYGEGETVRRAKAAEPQGYILKPFQGRELRITVDLVLARHRTEQELRESEARFRSMAEQTADLISITDDQGVIQYASPASRVLFRCAPNEMCGRHFMEFLDESAVATATAAFRATVETGQAASALELAMRRSDGSVFFGELRGSQYQLTGRHGSLVLIRDITERKQAETRLHDSEALYHSLVENLQQCVLCKDREGRFTFANQRFCELVRRPLAELVGRTDFDLFPFELAEKYRNDDRQVMDGGQPLETEERHRTADGEDRVMQLVKTPLRSADGQVTGVQGIFWDVTERKRAEEAIQASERRKSELLEKLNAAQQLAGIGSWDWDLGTNTVWWSDETYRIFGVTPDEYTPSFEGNASFVHPDDRTEYGRRFEHSLRTGAPLEFDLRLVTRNGIVKHCLAKGQVVYGAAGTPTRFVGTIMDITERKRAEEALRQSESRLRLAQVSSGAGMWDWDMLTGKIEWSEGLFRLFGLDPGHSEASFDVWRSVLHPADRELAEKRTETAVSDGASLNSEYRIVLPSGETRWINALGDTTYDAGGKPLRMAGICLDITERKQAEAEREQLQSQLSQSQKMESVGRLAGGVAHDFNNMLQVILGNAALALLDVPPDSPARESIEEIQKSAQRSANLTRQLLAYARKQTIAPKVLDLNATVEGTLKMLRRLIGENIELAWLPGRGLRPIRMDPAQIDQLLTNLCVNARDAIAGVGKIAIETVNVAVGEADLAGHPDAVVGDYVRLAIRDSGCGMDQETLSHLFEPFFTTKQIGQGTGLGLATVLGIVQQNGGFIQVESEPGRGTTFRIHLPCYVDDAAQREQEDPAQFSGRGHQTILLVEDEPAILRLGKRTLESLGYTVLTAATPGEAIRLAEQQAGEIHLLLTDVVMPEMNGRDLAQRLLARYPQLKRLFMSGYTADVIAQHGVLEAGVHFIQKPFSISTLADKVREVLNGRGE